MASELNTRNSTKRRSYGFNILVKLESTPTNFKITICRTVFKNSYSTSFSERNRRFAKKYAAQSRNREQAFEQLRNHTNQANEANQASKSSKNSKPTRKPSKSSKTGRVSWTPETQSNGAVRRHLVEFLVFNSRAIEPRKPTKQSKQAK